MNEETDALIDQPESKSLLSDSHGIDNKAAMKASNKTNGRDYLAQPKLSGKAWGRVWCKCLSLPFPVLFIVWNEFCERFSYYGMRAVLTLFCKSFLGFSDNSATAIYHGFIVMCYLTPILGAIISDSCLGKYGTIVSLSMVYAAGNILMAVSAIPFDSSRGANIGMSIVALIIIAFGTGGIKPCVAAFGGDQFKEEIVHLLPVFFSIFYFSINAGSVLSTLLTPVLRGYVKCFDEDECFPLAFGVPAALMIVAIIVFLIGTKWYIIAKPKRAAALIFFKVPFSVVYAIYRRIRFGKVPGARNIMDYATPKFSETFVYDVWLFMRVCVMLLPLPLFWALFDQQGSRWTLQALRMNGRFGKFVILPDQIQALNPIFILVLIPIFETLVYPLFAKIRLLKKPLQRMGTGMFLAGVAFIIAAIIEFHLESEAGLLKNGKSRVVLSNARSTDIMIDFNGQAENLSQAESLIFELDTGDINLTVTANDVTQTFPLTVQNQCILQVFVTQVDSELSIEQNSSLEWFPDGDKASITAFVGDIGDTSINFTIHDDSNTLFTANNLRANELSEREDISIGSEYTYFINYDEGSCNGTLSKLGSGGIYTIVIAGNTQNFCSNVKAAAANSPNSVSIFLQVPMYFVITVGEVLFSITGLEFAYSQAPPSMKSMCQAAWLLTVAFGNIVVVIIAESSAFDKQAYEFIFFACAIFFVTAIFAIMSFFYKYVDPAKLLVSKQIEDDKDKDRDHRENSSLIAEERYTLRASPSNSLERDSPSPPPGSPSLKAKQSDYESAF